MSAQAGASHVISLEASSIASKISLILKSANKGGSNTYLKDRIRVVTGMVENEDVQKEVLRTGKVDTIISEPIGVMLLHERMVSTCRSSTTWRDVERPSWQWIADQVVLG
jgi:histone-arginine methyltransferase CARM1